MIALPGICISTKQYEKAKIYTDSTTRALHDRMQ